MLKLLVLPDEFTLYRFDKNHAIPSSWLASTPWYTVSRTTDELSVLCPAECLIPTDYNKAKSGWRCLQVDEQMDFSLVGILASIIDPLREAKIPVFVVSTFNTDYILVKKEMLEKAIEVLNNKQSDIILGQGHSVLSN